MLSIFSKWFVTSSAPTIPRVANISKPKLLTTYQTKASSKWHLANLIPSFCRWSFPSSGWYLWTKWFQTTQNEKYHVQSVLFATHLKLLSKIETATSATKNVWTPTSGYSQIEQNGVESSSPTFFWLTFVIFELLAGCKLLGFPSKGDIKQYLKKAPLGVVVVVVVCRFSVNHLPLRSAFSLKKPTLLVDVKTWQDIPSTRRWRREATAIGFLDNREPSEKEIPLEPMRFHVELLG